MTSSAVAISIDGRIVAASEAVIPVLDRGFLYGDSVFEVLRTYEGSPFALRAHFERLTRSANRLSIALPVPLRTLAAEARELFETSLYRDAYLRVIVTRGTGPLTYDPSTARAPSRVIIAVSLPDVQRSVHEEGASVELVPSGRTPSAASLLEAKASNYLANLLAVKAAAQVGAHEAIFVGQGGEVLEGASSNLFVVRQGRVITPPTAGILAGVTRATVLFLAAGVGLEPSEKLLFPADLYGADEVFITSSIREMVPVVQVDGYAIGDGKPGPTTRALRDAFREHARRAAAQEGWGLAADR